MRFWKTILTRNITARQPVLNTPWRGLETLEPRVLLSASPETVMNLVEGVDDYTTVGAELPSAIPPVDAARVLHYAFDTNLGSTADDLSSYGNDGFIFNGQWLSEYDGRSGVLRFNGTSSYIHIGNPASLNFSGDMSFEMWMRWDAPEEPGQYAYIFGDVPQQSFSFQISGYQSLGFLYRSNEPLYGWEQMTIPVSRDILTDQWSHIAVVVEYPRMRFYHNGVLVTDAYMPIPGITQLSNHAKQIGGRNGESCMPMDLDEFRLYNRALTAAEIAAHAAGQEVAPGQANEAAVETDWYEDTVTVRLSSKGYDYSGGYTAQMTLLEGPTTVAGPITVPITEAFPGSGRYVASHAFSLAGLENKILNGVILIYDSTGGFVTAVSDLNVSLVKPDWVDTTEGYSNEVLAPWTPVVTDELPGGVLDIGVWGRQYEFGTTPFFQQIQTQQNDILSGAMSLTARADGSDLSWTPAATSLVSASDLKAEVDQIFVSTDGKLLVYINAVTEYDGYTIFDWWVQATQATSLENLILDIPLKTAYATLAYGDNVYENPTRLYRNHSGTVDGNLSFKFGPTVWLGNEEQGLTWQVESDQYWNYSDPQAATEILVNGATTTFRANLVNVSTSLGAGERLYYKFALMATPVKPMLRDAWDMRIARSEPYGADFELPDKMSFGKPTLEYYAEDLGLRNLLIDTHDIWPYPMPESPEYIAALERLVTESHAAGLNVYPYEIHQRYPTNTPEFDIHGLNMALRPMLWYIQTGPKTANDPRPGPMALDYGADSQGAVMYSPKSMALQDSYIYSLAQRLDQFGEDGVYLDGTSNIVADMNLLHGSGYIDEYGVLQETFPVFANREFMRRIYTVVKQRDPDNIVDVHNSGSYNMGGLAYADVMWNGEQFLGFDDYVHDDLPLDMFRTEFMGYQLGVAAETLDARLGLAMEVSATSLLHDVPVRIHSHPLVSALWRTYAKVWAVREQFEGQGEPIEKMLYWDNADYVSIPQADGYATLLKHPTNGVLALISNLSTTTQNLTVDFNLANLGLEGQVLDVFDALTDTPINMTAEGEISVSLGSEEWTYVWLKNGGEVASTLVIVETFDDVGDNPAGGNGYEWADIAETSIPSNPVGTPGVWHASGHVNTLNSAQWPLNLDTNWSPMVTGNPNKTSALGGSGHEGIYYSNIYPTGDGSTGNYAMDGILEFTLADHTPRPAVTGEKIVGSFLFWKNIVASHFGFGFTDSIADLKTYQAGMTQWSGGTVSPLMMPTGYTSYQSTSGGSVAVPFSGNVTGQIMIGGGQNGIWTHAVVDDSSDGWVDQGSLLPRTGTGPDDKPGDERIAYKIYFEYTVGNTTYDLLQWEEEGGGGVRHDIVQAASDVPNPGGPMPVGKVMTSIEGMFITGGQGVNNQVWYDNIVVEIVSAVSFLPGDANNDGVVSADDYGSVQLHFGDTGEVNIPGDANLDGVVSADDYGSVQLHFGETAGMGSVPVPEPATMGLPVVGLADDYASVQANFGVVPADPPVAENQNVVLDMDQTKSIQLTGYDPDGDVYTFIANAPSRGSLSDFNAVIEAVTYTPTTDYIGSDSFTFKLKDSMNAEDSTAILCINISAVAAGGEFVAGYIGSKSRTVLSIDDVADGNTVTTITDVTAAGSSEVSSIFAEASLVATQSDYHRLAPLLFYEMTHKG